MNKLASRTGLTEEGRDFLIACLDPMHDNQLTNLKGWPDVESAPSVVRCFKQSVSISEPAGLASAPVWDLYISTWPSLEALTAGTYNRVPPVGGNNSVTAIAPTTNPATIGGVNGYAVSANGQCNIGSSGVFQAFSLDGTAFNLTDPGRVIGVGLEVVNTTSDLNRQGTCTVWRQPQGRSTSSVYTLPGTTEHGFVSLSQNSLPPNTIANALLLAGSKQWKAAEGAYLVACFSGQDNPPRSAAYDSPVFLTTLDTDSRTPVNTTSMLGPTPVQSGGTLGQPYIMAPSRTVPTHTMGVIFSGLSSTTTLTLNWNVYYESFPNPTSDLVTLARPSCVYDPVALELLSRIMNTMPVGVPSEQNFDGEWFANIVNTLSSFAPVLGSVLGGPAGAALGTAVGTAGKALGAYLAPPSGVAMTTSKPTQSIKVVKRAVPTEQQIDKMVRDQIRRDLASRGMSKQPQGKKKKQNGRQGRR